MSNSEANSLPDFNGSNTFHDPNTNGHPEPCSGLAVLGVVGIGITGRVELLPTRDKVKKSPHPWASDHDRAWMRKHLDREVAVYQRLPKTHDRLIRMISYSTDDSDYNIVFDYLPNRDLRTFLNSHPRALYQSLRLRLQWALDAVEAVGLVHDYGIIHGDIKPSNFLVDEQLRLRLIDFSGSSIDNSPALVVENARFFLPRSRRDAPSSVSTDLFALGSTVYEILTSKQPFEEDDEEEVELKFNRGEFPTVDEVACGDFILNCWTGKFDTATAAAKHLKLEVKRLLGT